MFTGIIQSQAVLKEKKKSRKNVRLTFRVLGNVSRFKLGESVAIDGVCLTVAACRGKEFSADFLPETLASTTLRKLEPGERVNFERALRMGDSAGGHWVTGHVDGIGFIREFAPRGTNFRLQIEAPPDIIPSLVRKGSVAVDGMSLTLQEVRNRHFVVGVTPHTYRVTTLPWKRTGDPVNLEVDLLAKLVRKFIGRRKRSSLREKDLRRQGF